MGLLITKTSGPRVRLGAVTTDAPLQNDTVKQFSITSYCENCKACAELCPAKAVSPVFDPDYRQVNPEACYQVLRELHTDCGVCVAACPFGEQHYSSEDLLKTYMYKKKR